MVFDAGYDVARLAWLLKDLPVEVLGRLRSNRVLYFPPPPRRPGRGRPSRHGQEFKLADEATWPEPAVTTLPHTTRYGTAVAAAWDRLHSRLTSRAAWEHHDGELPVIEGTLLRLQVDHLPGDRDPSRCGCGGQAPARCPLTWTGAGRRSCAGSTSTWLVIACYTKLRLARPLAIDLRRPWEKPAPPGRLTPARVRRGFRYLRVTATCPAGAPKPGKPGPGRPPGSKNRHPAPIRSVGKTSTKT